VVQVRNIKNVVVKMNNRIKKNFKKVFVILGSNIGNRKENLKKAIIEIMKLKKIKIFNMSSLYLSKPWGYLQQDNFYNIALLLIVSYTPLQLLKKLKKIEKKLGREKNIRYGPRIIDIDIILYEDYVIKRKNLIIPHKQLTKRDFFLKPLLEIDKNLINPITKKKLEYYLKKLKNKNIIKRINFDL